jgi:copper chaperone CopZ
MKSLYVILIFSVLIFCGCRIRDERELIIKVPQMQTEQDVVKVRAALVSLNGVDLQNARFDLPNHTVTVSFDSMVVANKNIEIAIAEAGYDANKIAAIKK